MYPARHYGRQRPLSIIKSARGGRHHRGLIRGGRPPARDHHPEGTWLGLPLLREARVDLET